MQTILAKQRDLTVCSDDERTDTQLPLLVTAAVDAIYLRRRLDLSQDVQVSGQVVWTGKSAMDIRMQLTQASGFASSEAVRQHNNQVALEQ